MFYKQQLFLLPFVSIEIFERLSFFLSFLRSFFTTWKSIRWERQVAKPKKIRIFFLQNVTRMFKRLKRRRPQQQQLQRVEDKRVRFYSVVVAVVVVVVKMRFMNLSIWWDERRLVAVWYCNFLGSVDIAVKEAFCRWWCCY